MSTKEWFASMAETAEDLGYGIAEITRDRIVLVARQQRVRITIEAPELGSFLVFSRLRKIEHVSGMSYTHDYETTTR